MSLAERFNGEIINGDALQMYEGLPIATNKIRPEERKGIPHHLLGCVKLDEEPWTVRKFRDRANTIIQEIRSRGNLPILVGGTHYYTQSLLFEHTVIDDENSEHGMNKIENDQKWPILEADTRDMLKELRKVDPIMASRWHPNDRRKIRRSLELWLNTGKKASDLYYEQRQERSVVDLDDTAQLSGGKPESSLAHDTLILWTYASSDSLNQRLAERVDDMISDGLLDEVESMYDSMQFQARQGKAVDQSRGIWVAIGFKELLPYIMTNRCSEKLRQEGIEHTKIANRQYAKRQVRWIRLKLQRALDAAGLSKHLFLLDTTNLMQWHGVVEEAQHVLKAFLDGGQFHKPMSLSEAAKELLVMTEEEPKSARYCKACEKTLMTEQEWVKHLKSKGHKSAMRPKIDWQSLYPKDTAN